MGADEGLILNLPVAPSCNTFAHDRRGRPLGNQSPSVMHWKKLADGFLLTQKRRQVEGPYILSVEYCMHQFHSFDLSNRTKALEDYLQSRALIENDRYCWELHASWKDDVEKDWCRVGIKTRGW